MTESIESNKGNPITQFLKALVARRDPFKLESESIKDSKIEDNNLLKNEIALFQNKANNIVNLLNDQLKESGNGLRVSRKDFDKALKYLVPERELKTGGSISVKGGEKITYEEIQEIAKNVGSVASAGRSGDKQMPRIFIMPELPVLDFETRYIADNLLVAASASAVSYRNNGSIILHPDFTGKLDSSQIKGAIAHEKGHDKDFRERGKIVLQENKNVGAAIEESKITSCLNHDREYRADLYATLGGYGSNLVSVLADLKMPTDNYHPSSAERISKTNKVMDDTAFYTQQLKNDIAEFRKYASEPTNSSNSAKTPVPANSVVSKHCIEQSR